MNVVMSLLLPPPSERSEWRRQCASVLVCVLVHSEPLNQTVGALNPYRFKTVGLKIGSLWTSNLAGNMYVPDDSLDMKPWIFLEKGAWPWSRDHRNFSITWRRHALSRVHSSY